MDVTERNSKRRSIGEKLWKEYIKSERKKKASNFNGKIGESRKKVETEDINGERRPT